MEFDLVRIIFAFLCGYFLCVSGSLSQLTTNNQIASPSTLGMDGLAVLNVLFVTIAFGLGINFLGSELASFFLFSFTLAAIYFLSGKSKFFKESVYPSNSIKKIVLLGLTFNLLVGAIFSVVQFFFMALNLDFPSGLWFGSFKFANIEWLYLFLPLFLFSTVLIGRYSNELEKLNLGAPFARGLGVDVAQLQRNTLLLSLLLTGLVICFFGVFSFLGLVFPHILRSFKIFERSIRLELLLGSLIAGLSLCFIDLLCYNLTYQGAELPVGMVSGVIGSFFLIFLVLKSKI